jgi:Tfp pilus assembly protein PilX
VYFSNRSAANLSNGDAEAALEDGESCIKAKPDWSKVPMHSAENE